ncbi:MAG: glycosyltransferase family 39 protein [Flavobacteriales bacterium]|nr:glycosyltransferase family 39 protein [Flavobacteriales bacterium]
MQFKIAWGFLLLALGLVFFNFLSFRSLWSDEAKLALNITDRSWTGLLKALDHNQVAPIGYLMLEKTFSLIFGNSDWSMRIVSIVSFFVSVYFFLSITVFIFKDKLTSLYATTFYATTILVVSYSAEVKQYMTDVVVGLTLTYYAILYIEGKLKDKWWLYSIIGVIAIWLSNVAVLLLFLIGLYILYTEFKASKRNYSFILKVPGSWLISFIFYYYAFIDGHPSTKFMVEYWQNAGAFISHDVLDATFYRSVSSKFTLFFEMMNFSVYSMVFLPFPVIGLYKLYRKVPGYFYLLISPFVLHLIIAYFKIYPFSKRMILYQFPNFVLILFYGFSVILNFFQKYKALNFLFPLLISSNIFMLFRYGFPIEKEEIKKSMSYIRSNYTEGEKIYVYYGATPAFQFYRDLFGPETGITDKDIVLTSSNRNNWSKYQKPISGLNSSVWILFSHVTHKRNENDEKEDEYIVNKFTERGFLIDREQIYVGSSVYHAKKP